MAEYVIKVIVDPTQAEAGVKRVGSALDNTGRQAEGLGRTIKAAFAFFTVGYAVRELKQLSDASIEVENRLKIAGVSTDNLSAATQRLFEISNKTRTPIQANAQLLSRLGIASDALGASQEDLFKFVELVGKALAIQGSSATTARGAILQLAQATGAGIVRAEEFNSILEGALPLAQAAAAGMSLTVAELRRAVVAGEVDSKKFFDAIMSQADALDAQFKKTGATLSQVFTIMENNFILLITNTNRTTSALTGFVQVLKFFADNLTVIVPLLLNIGAAFLALKIQSYVTGMIAAAGATNILSTALIFLKANPILSIIFAITTLLTLLTTLGDSVVLSADGFVTLGSVTRALISTFFMLIQTAEVAQSGILLLGAAFLSLRGVISPVTTLFIVIVAIFIGLGASATTLSGVIIALAGAWLFLYASTFQLLGLMAFVVGTLLALGVRIQSLIPIIILFIGTWLAMKAVIIADFIISVAQSFISLAKSIGVATAASVAFIIANAPIILIAAGLTAIAIAAANAAGAFKDLDTTVQRFVSFFQSSFPGIGESVDSVSAKIDDLSKNFLDLATSGTKSFKGVADAGSDAVSDLRSEFAGVEDAISGPINRATNKAVNDLKYLESVGVSVTVGANVSSSTQSAGDVPGLPGNPDIYKENTDFKSSSNGGSSSSSSNSSSGDGFPGLGVSDNAGFYDPNDFKYPNNSFGDLKIKLGGSSGGSSSSGGISSGGGNSLVRPGITNSPFAGGYQFDSFGPPFGPSSQNAATNKQNSILTDIPQLISQPIVRSIQETFRDSVSEDLLKKFLIQDKKGSTVFDESAFNKFAKALNYNTDALKTNTAILAILSDPKAFYERFNPNVFDNGNFPSAGFAGSFAKGGSFSVPGSGGTDSKLITMRATPGERVTVDPLSSKGGGGGGNSVSNNYNVSITVNTPDVDGFRRSERQIASRLRNKLGRVK